MTYQPLDQILAQHFKGGHACLRVVTVEEEEAVRAVVHAALATGRSLMGWSVIRGVHDGLLAGGKSVPQTENPAAGLLHLANQAKGSIVMTLDVVPHLREDTRVLRALRELIARCEATNSTLVMVDHEHEVPVVLRSQSVLIEPPLPGRAQVEQILRSTLKTINQVRRIEADLSRGELSTMLRNLQGLSPRQIEQVIRDATAEDARLSIDDLNHVLAAKRRLMEYGGVLEFVESPTSIDSIGGLNRLKQWLQQRKACLRDDAEALGLTPPRGVLILGVQGSGKSLCAKAIGTAWGRPIVRMDAGALYDRYVGESERRLREALRQAEMMAPVILWIDEIEKAFASAASTSTDGGLSRRMFGTLLTWMQERTEPVFLAATANDIEALPPELLRKGRFDEIFFVDLPGAEARKAILTIHLTKRRQDLSRLDIDALVEASTGYSGAEIEQGIVSALAEAFSSGGAGPGTSATQSPTQSAAHPSVHPPAGVQLTTERLVETLASSPPLSVTMRERISELRSWALGPPARCMTADDETAHIAQ